MALFTNLPVDPVHGTSKQQEIKYIKIATPLRVLEGLIKKLGRKRKQRLV